MNKARFLSLLFLFLHFNIKSQTELTGIINQYAKVTAIEHCSSTLTVSNAQVFSVGENILLIQMQAGVASPSNNNSFGTVTAIGSAGLFEKAEIVAINDSDIVLKNKLIHQYDPTRSLQIVSFPSFENATVKNVLSAASWNGEIGGVLALEVNGTLLLDGTIDVSGLGFQGGEVQVLESDCNFAFQQKAFFYEKGNWRGAAKGEGVVPISEGMKYGRGAWANAGGGGNDHNSGGGGGANISAGGNGGNYFTSTNFGCRGNHPGLGAYALPIEKQRIFLGGGGGAGHVDDINGGSPGGTGGGIVFIIAKTIQTNNNIITANGITAQRARGEGAGGGGAGGTIVLEVKEIIDPLALLANGGNGGQTNGSDVRCFGPGGGGSGGRIICSIETSTSQWKVEGGAAGTIVGSLSECDNETNNAQNGELGQISFLPNLIPSGTQIVAAPSFLTQVSQQTVCETETAQFNIEISGSYDNIQWQINTGSGFQDISANNIYSGVNSLNLSVLNISNDMLTHQFRVLVSSECFGEIISESAGLEIANKAIALFDYTETNSTFSFENLSQNATQFVWDFGDGTTSLETNPNHSFSAGEDYTVSLSATNNCGTDIFSLVISTTIPPVAIVNSNNPHACVPYTVDFSGIETQNATNYFWKFPGGSPNQSEETMPSITYSEAGVYDVIFYAKNSAGIDSIVLENYVQLLEWPVADFEFEIEGNTVLFKNLSQNAVDYQWDFGDDSAISTEENPMHTYAHADFYIVKLQVRNPFCGTAKAADVSIVLPTATNEILDQNFISIFPNPSKNIFQIHWKNIPISSFTLLKFSGQEIQTYQTKENTVLQIDLSHLPNGMYFLQYVADGKIGFRKLLKIGE